MKQTTRKLLSLLMALAIVLSLAPAARAVEMIYFDTSAPSTVVAGETANLYNHVIVYEGSRDQITWGSLNPAVATVSNGTVTGISAGSVTITATYQGATATHNMTVTTPALTGIQLSQYTLSLTAGGSSATLTATRVPAAATGTIEWTSSNPSVASVSQTGTVTPLAEGTTNITAKCGNIVSTPCVVTVAPAPTPTISVAVVGGYSSVALNGTLGLNVTAANAPTGSVIKWSIASTSTGSGTITGIQSPYTFTAERVGSVIITAGLYSSSSATTALVTSDPITITVTSNTVTLPLSAASITIPYQQTSSSYAIYPAVTSWAASWPTASYIDWTASNSNVRIISTSNTSSQSWGSTARTTASNSVGVYIYGAATGSATLTAVLKDSNGNALASNSVAVTIGSTGFTVAAYDPSNTSAVYLNNYSTSNGYYYRTFTADPRLNGTSIRNNSNYSIYYVWTVNGYTVQNTAVSNGYSYTLFANNQYLNRNNSNYNTLTCTAYVQVDGTTASASNYAYYNYVTWNVYSDYYREFTVGVTVYDTNPGYDLKDTPDEGNTGSIADQINNWVRNHYYYGTSSDYYRYYRVRIPGGTTGSTSAGNYASLGTSGSTGVYYDNLDEIIFKPLSSVSSVNGYYTASFTFYVDLYYDYSISGSYDHTVTGTMTFTVKQGTASSGDISYVAQTGKDVAFDVDDFERFWTSKYSSGYLTSVVFRTPSGTPSGTVYNSSNKSVGSSSYYVSPASNQNGLAGVYFSPSTSKTGTVRIPFTATGQTSSSGNSAYTKTLSGTVVITYLSAAANKITYSTDSNGRVTLSAQDFIDAYKSAVNTSSTPSNLTIQFQDVPAYGTLTYTGGSRDVLLTSSNVRNYKFSTNSSGSNRISTVTYSVSSSRNDTISYIGYVGSTATFTGEVTFNAVTAPEDVKVAYTCYAATGIALAPANFTSAHSAMSSASYVVLGSPRTGKLSYSGGPATSAILINSLGSVTYIPSTAVTGTATTDSFTFVAYNSGNVKVASGTVTITISLPAAPSNPNAITNISQFTDIPAAGGSADWYRTPLTYLINKGVINGKGNGKFGPRDEVEYSEALKFIMNAAGIVETEVSTPGVNWAQNYKTRAVNAGWISSDVDLTKPIPRTAMVELAAKVLGIPASSAASPFTDTTNQWAVALYNVTPRIITGSNDPKTGKLIFQPDKALYRDEMVSLVYRMYQYSGK